MANRSAWSVLTCILLLATLLSGCISAPLAKDLLNPEEGEVEYKVRERVTMIHHFETVVTDGSTTENHTTNTTNILQGTKWIRVHIETTLDPLPPLPVPLPVGVQRYVKVTITMPNGVTWFEKTYNETGIDSLEILGPASGIWVFQVNAVGYGSDSISYHDGYKVFVNVLEPTRR